VKTDSGKPEKGEIQTCPVCGTNFSVASDSGFCPVCILHGAAGGESTTTGEPDSVTGLVAASTEEADGGLQARRFENYEVMLDADGRPIELGRGAMGVTYRALDVDLRYPIALNFISERYRGDALQPLISLKLGAPNPRK
jgi:hypothetical protein